VSKRVYFEQLSTKVTPKNRITAHFPGKQVELHITITRSIIEDIIGKMLVESSEKDAEIMKKQKHCHFLRMLRRRYCLH
jgi:hypothetical protein